MDTRTHRHRHTDRHTDRDNDAHVWMVHEERQ